MISDSFLTQLGADKSIYIAFFVIGVLGWRAITGLLQALAISEKTTSEVIKVYDQSYDRLIQQSMESGKVPKSCLRVMFKEKGMTDKQITELLRKKDKEYKKIIETTLKPIRFKKV